MTPREIRFTVNGLTGLVVMSVAAALANLTWRLAGEGGAPSAVSAAMDAYVLPAPAPDLGGMISLPPFGSASGTATSAAPSNLVLHGVLATVPASASSALIASGETESVSYRVGDVLTGGLTLAAIGTDYVILSAGGRQMALYFPGDPRAQQATTLPGAPVQAAAGSAGQGVRDIRTLLPPSLTGRPTAAPPVQPPPPPPPPPSQNSSVGSGLIDSPGASVTRQGYRLGSNVPPQLRAAGLAPGDVIASVNGVSAATLAGDPRRLAQAIASGNARVEVLRGSERLTVAVPSR